MRTWPSLEAWARYMRLEGFVVGKTACAHCGHRWPCAIEPHTGRGTLCCPKCNQPAGVFTEGKEQE